MSKPPPETHERTKHSLLSVFVREAARQRLEADSQSSTRPRLQMDAQGLEPQC